GSNRLALLSPAGFIGYRAYLSPDAPKQYPFLGAGGNAQWVDFCEWSEDTRVSAIRRGMSMIRQVDPNRSIVLMAPNEYVGRIKELAEAYGGEMHDTGAMGGFYVDQVPMLSSASGLPFSVEPGGPPRSLAEYKKMMGLYFSENIQALDYYMHIGDVF